MKEWRPRPTSVNSAQGSGVWGTSEVQPITAEAVACLVPSSGSTSSKDTSLKLQKKLEDLQFSETHVITPNHLQVPESRLTSLSFGSFDADFGLSMRFANVPDGDRSLAQLSKSSKVVEENVDKPSTMSSNILMRLQATTDKFTDPLLMSRNPSVLSSTGPTPLVTQAAGVILSSLAINQQPIPCFGQPAGVHLSHCPPNYISYNQYFSPFYVPTPTLHHLLSNTAFPQQLSTGSIYPHPAAATPANPV
ncbi:putative GBF-interacting protein 1-like [Cocos nucifera]|uniref:Putative GBF-interacting protein 1-like n=1 Tax=Cocos nucifera TaxID=13894 RepID=A0A8K0N9H0_COCNU|nr:putative GBF-interacting protein 1-like [Cocos nucifera]